MANFLGVASGFILFPLIALLGNAFARLGLNIEVTPNAVFGIWLMLIVSGAVSGASLGMGIRPSVSFGLGFFLLPIIAFIFMSAFATSMSGILPDSLVVDVLFAMVIGGTAYFVAGLECVL